MLSVFAPLRKMRATLLAGKGFSGERDGNGCLKAGKIPFLRPCAKCAPPFWRARDFRGERDGKAIPFPYSLRCISRLVNWVNSPNQASFTVPRSPWRFFATMTSDVPASTWVGSSFSFL